MSHKILIVDDDPSVREAIYEILAMNGYTVSTVGGGGEALSRMEGEFFDLVITDFRMPDMDGGTLLEQMRKKRIQTAALVVSGFLSPSDQKRLKAIGAIDVLAKPFSVPTLLDAVQRGLQ